ncbi:SOS response-associated peptidase [Oricola sp.]|uniref:SOS response-associated peptidase n=1 Tax=Oricola sp. TaxID=1979950 RepID=UPI0025F6E807|nr:SOS response-associated peptidase [Oricola sp.]MCI5076807.1 SOS response-associated peptidase [Oricola sp.]
MCGRFTLFTSWTEIYDLYNLTRDADRGRNTAPRYNIAPTQDVPFVHLDKEGNQVVSDGQWWLVPHWAKEKPKWAMFNARSEDADKKPAFRDAFKSKRCLIPADGFYEWTKADDGGKDPWWIHLPDARPFSFAGLWAHNDALDITSCTILTAAATEPVKQLHDRMPIILDPDAYDAWLDPENPADEAKALLNKNLDGQLEFHRVSRNVNTFKYHDADAIEPI